MSDASAKQQIVDKVKSSTNILVTVSNNPSVDELSAALGLTLLLNKMKKHATAVFSGDIPPAINFLDPEKTFENTVDSLRDFIIALDKEKADHLRYKVEGDVVKIFITPYRTTITSEDLDFSQGDYNVELVLALGVKQQGNLDKALEAHGQILDDATVVTLVAGGGKSDLGSLSWRDENASSLSEMVVGLSETLKTDKTLIDEQIATAFLAGIVAATERFSNNRTSARVMTMAAQLMGAGANQQLIASKFEEATDGEDGQREDTAGEAPEAPENQEVTEVPSADEDPEANGDGTTDLSEGESTKVDRDSTAPAEETTPEDPPKDEAGTLSVSHELEGTLDQVAEQKAVDDQEEAAKAAEEAANAAQSVTAAEQELNDTLPLVAPVSADISPIDLQQDIQAASAAVDEAAAPAPLQGAVSSEVWKNSTEPIYGGTLNATSEAAAEDSRKFEDDERNKVILSHSGEYIADQMPTYNAPLNAASQPPEEQTMVNPLSAPGNPTIMAAPLEPLSTSQNEGNNQDYQPGSMSLPPLPDFSTLPPIPVAPPADELGGAVPEPKLGDILPPANPALQAAPTNDPAQFRIPGQS